jgi:glycerol-3-phosphate acyltransferase PlsX
LKIAIDAMGGDNAPGEIIKGALEAAEHLNQKIILVGDKNLIQREVGNVPDNLSIEHAPEVISMGEPPAAAVRHKKNSSIVRAMQLVKNGTANAVVSAGNTGAVMAAGVLLSGLITGIDRPAIATVLPTRKGRTLLIDAGANVDCKPFHLYQFAVMGHLYMKEILGVGNPRLGLLSIGGEATKGNELTLAAYQVLQQSGVNFIGNVEGCDIFEGNAEVVVCDGFVGNMVLKVGEGMINALLHMAKEELKGKMSAKIGMAILAPSLRKLGKKLDYSEYGGAPLLGLNNVTIICHGRSQAKAIYNAIRVARETVENNLIMNIEKCIKQSLSQKVSYL